LFRFLDEIEPNGETNLNTSLREYSVMPRRAGLLILISDLFAEDGYESGLRQLLGRGHEVAMIHVLAPDELDPPLAGDLQLVDVETSHAQDVSLDGGLRTQYRARVRAWIQSMQANSRKQGVRYLEAVTNQPWDHLLMLEMRRAGIVK
jgi:hypothetical protein